jgi:capsular exopolysaccharide synthesis family protein
MFQDADVRQSQGQSRRRRLFLEEQLREVNAELARSEAALTAFRSREQLFSPREKFQAEQTSLSALDMRLGELDADRRMYQSLLANLQDTTVATGEQLRALVTPSDISTNPVIFQLYQQLSQYQTSRDSLTTGQWRSTANNPDVARLDQLIAASQQRLIGAVARPQSATIDAAARPSVPSVHAMRRRSRRSPRAQSAEEQLSLRLASNRALADRLRDEYQNARMAEAVEAGQVEVMDVAPIPYRPVSRLRNLRLLLGLLIGFGIGCGGALLIDSRNAPVTGRPDLEDHMQLPVLSVIPPIDLEPPKTPRFSRLSAVLRPGTLADGSDRNGIARAGGIALLSPAGAEAFRLLRSSLRWTQRDGPGRTLAVSSAVSGEGKTTTSANLAAAFALEGKKVLLIDCDLRRPRLHKVFRLPRQPGIAQVLWAGVSPSVAVRETFISGLFVLPSGAYTERFGDLVGSGRMPSVLAELSACFDMIILDTPPVLAVADAAAVAPLVDGLLLVVAGATNRHAVSQALKQLERVGARVVGAVLNDSRGDVERYGGYQHYYHQYPAEYARTTNTA